MLYFWVLLSVLFVPLRVWAVLPPTDPLCATVDQAGAVTLTWSQPADPLGEFDRYAIYRATTEAGPYVLAGSVTDWNITSFVDPVADARTGPVFYYITTFTNGVPEVESVPGITISTIYLQVFQSTPLGNADLSWNHLAVPSTAEDSFSVWMEYPIGTLQHLATVTSDRFTYQHVVSICEDSLTFIVRREGLGCTFTSNWDGDVFRDVTPPSIPMVTTVTVDTTTAGSGLASISWIPSPEADTDGYIILFNAPGGAVIIDTVWGGSSSSFQWDESTAWTRPEQYTVAAFDTCYSGFPASPNTSATQPFHRTIFLDYSYDACDGSVRLNWTPYVGWPVQEYLVYMRLDGGIWSQIAVVNAGVSAYDVAVTPFRDYCFVVVASQGAALPNSISNKTCLTTDYPGLPTFNYMRLVTVSGAAEITVVDSVDLSASVSGYRLERSENGGPYEELTTFGPVSATTITYTDTDVNPSSSGYRYRMVVLDDCGNVALTSNVGSSVLLKAAPDLNGFNVITWNGYQEWAGAIGGHLLYRSVGSGPEELLQVLPPDPWVYVDDVSALTSTTGRFCYRVEALEAGNPIGLDMVSESNIACAVQQELVFIPNAFMVGGNNPVFKPELVYADVTTYELSIINRWGQVFWTTTDPAQGWDGTAGGRQVPMGVYAYYCRFRNGAGKEFEKRGTVTMLTAVD